MITRDKDLVTAFLDGNAEAFEELMGRYQREVFYLVKSLVFDTEEAGDITQRSFIAAFRNLKKLKEREKFRQWLIKIAINLARDHLKTRKSELEFEGWMEPDCRNIPEKRVIEKDLNKNVKEALSLLPVRQQEVVNLRIFQGFSFHEIARILEIKKTTARTNFHFGIKTLRKHLIRRGINHEV